MYNSIITCLLQKLQKALVIKRKTMHSIAFSKEPDIFLSNQRLPELYFAFIRLHNQTFLIC